MHAAPVRDQSLLHLAKHKGGMALEDSLHLAWRTGPEPPRWFSRSKLAGLVIDLEYGEQMTVLACRKLQELLTENPPASRILEAQIADELAHAKLYSRYRQHLAESAEVSPYLRQVFDRCLSWQGHPMGLVLAFHVVLESEAVRLQRFLADHLSCPLFSALNRRILVDEARHVAFGRIYGEQGFAGLETEERLQMYLWVKSLWWDCAEQTRAGLTGPGGRLLRAMGPDLADMWRQQQVVMQRLGLLQSGEADSVERG